MKSFLTTLSLHSTHPLSFLATVSLWTLKKNQDTVLEDHIINTSKCTVTLMLAILFLQLNHSSQGSQEVLVVLLLLCYQVFLVNLDFPKKTVKHILYRSGEFIKVWHKFTEFKWNAATNIVNKTNFGRLFSFMLMYI